MTDIIDRSDEPIVLRETTLDQGASKPKVKVRSQYIPPLDGSQDLVDQFDMSIAKGVMLILTEKYYGYDWKVAADSKQGIVYFSIPSLMGPTLHYLIRLAEYADLTPELIMRCAGELLERMNLPRSRVDIARYYEAIARRHTFEFGDSLKKRRA